MSSVAYRYRFYPTQAQAENLQKTFGCVRVVYNKMLFNRQQAYFEHQEKINYYDTSFLLSVLKKTTGYEWLNDVSSVALQQSLRHLNAAYINFFAGRAKYPNFKKKSSKQSATYARTSFKWDGENLKLAKQDTALKIKWSRRFKGDPSTVTITKDASGRYFVSILVEENIQLKPVINKTIGIDLGLTHFLIDSNGNRYDNEKHLAKRERRLAFLQREMSRKTKGSNNRNKARIKVAKLHAKIADCRRDFNHKLSAKIVNENQIICTETLAIKNMMKNHCLAKSINDVGWSQFLTFLNYKSEWYGRTLVGIDKWYPSSKRCSNCGHTANKMPLNIRHWICEKCNTEHDRDINAAVNIKAAGLAVLACGENVSQVDSISSCNSL